VYLSSAGATIRTSSSVSTGGRAFDLGATAVLSAWAQAETIQESDAIAAARSFILASFRKGTNAGCAEALLPKNIELAGRCLPPSAALLVRDGSPPHLGGHSCQMDHGMGNADAVPVSSAPPGEKHTRLGADTFVDISMIYSKAQASASPSRPHDRLDEVSHRYVSLPCKTPYGQLFGVICRIARR
jgi:hypothetical protein